MTSYRWDKLPISLNVADHDLVVLNWAAFEDKELAEGFPPERLPSTESMTRLVFSPNAEVVAIGNPSTMIGSMRTEPRRLIDPRRRADYWLPFSIGVEDDVGTQYSVDADEWAAYFEHVSGWRWIATGEGFPQPYMTGSDYLRPVSNTATDVVSVFQPIATTRFLKFIALRVPLAAIRYTRVVPTVFGTEPDRSSGEVVLEASPVFWLPTPDRVSVAEAIDTILRERYGVAEEARVPDWAIPYSLPAEETIA